MQSPRCALTAGTHSSVGAELRGKQPVSMPAPGLLASPSRQSCWRKRGTDGKGLVEGLLSSGSRGRVRLLFLLLFSANQLEREVKINYGTCECDGRQSCTCLSWGQQRCVLCSARAPGR